MCRTMSCTWISKLFGLRLSSLTERSSGRREADDSRGGGRALAERLDDPSASERLLAPVEHRALTGRHATLWDAELDANASLAHRLDDRRGIAPPVPDPDIGLERSACGGPAGHPGDPVRHEPAAREQLSRSDHDSVPRGVDLEDVGRGPRRDAEATALPDRERRGSSVSTEH